MSGCEASGCAGPREASGPLAGPTGPVNRAERLPSASGGTLYNLVS